MFIDIHCHLDAVRDIDGAVARARERGVDIILTQGTDKEDNRKVLELAEKYDEVKACLGIYPLNALNMSDKELEDEIKWIENQSDKIIAIGEVGMDFKDKHSGRNIEKQEETFRKFIRLSIKLDKPIIVHSRKAEERCIEILEEEKAKKVIMHCFCGKKKFVERIEENDWWITVPTTVTRLEQFQDIAKNFPIEKIFCETDAPFLHPDKGAEYMSNEPCNVVKSYEKIAELRNMKLEEVEKQIENNLKEITT